MLHELNNGIGGIFFLGKLYLWVMSTYWNLKKCKLHEVNMT